MRIRLRGIYATALTEYFLDSGHEIVQPSPSINSRFDAELQHMPADVTVDMSRDRQGISVTGPDETTETLTTDLKELSDEIFHWPDPTPFGAIFDGVVDDTRGGAAILSLPGGNEGYLPFDAVDGYVDIGDTFRVQVIQPTPPWSDRAPLVSPDISVSKPMVTLHYGSDGISVESDSVDATELARSTELLSTNLPEDWGVEWHTHALEAPMDARDKALSAVADLASSIGSELEQSGSSTSSTPRTVAMPFRTVWAWFGRNARFTMDTYRREVLTTMIGHHRIKAGSDNASDAVDFVERICGGPTEEFPTQAVFEQFGPREGSSVQIQHGKPNGDLYTLGEATVSSVGSDGKITVRRTMKGSGTYDALGTTRSSGDIAVTKVVEGREWYPTVYQSPDGEKKGTYVNICTPIEVFPNEIRYVDLHIDVIKRPDGTVEIVDADELSHAVESGNISESLAERAKQVASRVKKALE